MTDDQPLPTGWSSCGLGKVAAVSAGIGFPNKLQGNTTGDLPFFKVADISRAVLSNRGLLAEPAHFVTLEVAAQLRGKPLKAGATVFAKTERPSI